MYLKCAAWPWPWWTSYQGWVDGDVAPQSFSETEDEGKAIIPNVSKPCYKRERKILETLTLDWMLLCLQFSCQPITDKGDSWSHNHKTSRKGHWVEEAGPWTLTSNQNHTMVCIGNIEDLDDDSTDITCNYSEKCFHTAHHAVSSSPSPIAPASAVL